MNWITVILAMKPIPQPIDRHNWWRHFVICHKETAEGGKVVDIKRIEMLTEPLKATIVVGLLGPDHSAAGIYAASHTSVGPPNALSTRNEGYPVVICS